MVTSILLFTSSQASWTVLHLARGIEPEFTIILILAFCFRMVFSLALLAYLGLIMRARQMWTLNFCKLFLVKYFLAFDVRTIEVVFVSFYFERQLKSIKFFKTLLIQDSCYFLIIKCLATFICQAFQVVDFALIDKGFEMVQSAFLAVCVSTFDKADHVFNLVLFIADSACLPT